MPDMVCTVSINILKTNRYLKNKKTFTANSYKYLSYI